MDQVLLIFVKYPQPKAVKTRLAAAIGDNLAADFYQTLTELIIQMTASENYKRIVYYTPADKKKNIEKWLGQEILSCPQQGRSLGERLQNAFAQIFEQGAKKIIAIGSDAPLVTCADINKAFYMLGKNPCVMGPSEDGGYYLIGLKANDPIIFQGIEWGSSRVFDQTVSRLNDRKITFECLPDSFDIDTLDDVRKLKNCLGHKLYQGQHAFDPLRRLIGQIL